MIEMEGTARGFLPTREHFVRVLDGLRDQGDAAGRLDRMLRDDPAFSASADFFSGAALVSANAQELVDLLGAVFGDPEAVSMYCFELDYGRKWEPGVLTVDGADVRLSDAGSLYDHLVSSIEGR